MSVLWLIAGQAVAADQTLVLAVVINGHPTANVGEFVLRDGALYVQRDELSSLGFRVPATVAMTHDNLVPVAALPGVTARVEMASQTLQVTAANASLLPELLRAGVGARAGPVQSGTGATLNYDITGTSVGDQRVGSGLFDFRGFSNWGVVSSGMLGYLGGSPNDTGRNQTVRLDSTYTLADPAALRQFQLGDFINGGLSWTRPVRLGGAEISSDFALRPDLITFPLPSVSSAVSVPSTVDVMVNGMRLLSQQVEPGPFQVPQLPVVTGAGTVALTVTDALGRQVTTTLPFYASSSLLASGLQSYSVEVGAVRQDWGVLSNDYGQGAASGTYRRGLTNFLTVELHAEGAPGVAMGGGGLVVNLANQAVANFAAAGSQGNGTGGKQLSAGIQRLGRTFSLGVSASVADHDFRDIAAVYGDPVPRLQLNAYGGLSLGRFGSVGIAYTATDRDATPAPITFYLPPGSLLPPNGPTLGGVFSVSRGVVTFLPAEHSHVLSASYSLQIRKVSIYLTGFHDFAADRSTGVLFGVTVPIGSRSEVTASRGSGSTGGYSQVQATQSADAVGDFGYQVYAATGNPDHEFAEGQYKSPWALLTVGADRIDHQTTLRAEGQGAVSFIDGGWFPSNTINDSFAVVDTNGMKDIRVTDENRPAGRTDSAGQLLLPDLRSFDVNRIAIEPTDVPVDASVPFVSQEVRPQDRSGIVVRFPVHVSHGAVLRLVDAAGQPVPEGSIITLQATGATAPVGYDGEAYLEGLAAQNHVVVEQPDGRECAASFAYRPEPGTIPTLGPLRCEATQ